MTRLTYYRVKNAMLFTALFSNLIGVMVVRFLTQGSISALEPEILQLAGRIENVFMPFSFLLPMAIILIYEKPIRDFFKSRYEQRPLPEALIQRANRRLLNEPFFLIGLSFCMWLIAAVVYSGIFWLHNAGPAPTRFSFFRSLYTGLITTTVAFFVLEFILQRRVVPYVFPSGGLSAVPGTIRIRIRTRLTAFLFACNIIPLVSILQHAHGRFLSGKPQPQDIVQFQSSLAAECVVFLAIGIWLTFLVSSNLTKPLQEITLVLRKVQHGLFENKVQVTSNDEIGYAGDVINEMTRGLLERDRMKQSLALAQEIQQNLFPKDTFIFSGLDVAGKSVYCDETGGDYFDFIPRIGGDDHKLGVVIGDVSGHGISSALLMATVRSALRQRAMHPGSASQMVSNVNWQMVQDIENSGEFVTLFFLVIDTAEREIAWVRAGHDPALVYDPAHDAFKEIAGVGLALGVDSSYIYREQKMTLPEEGRVILLGTDGVWEAPNAQGNRFGKEAVQNTVRANHVRSAAEILDAILSAQAAFLGEAKKEDDATLVVIKI
jgi:phosphoserine phosphatase RsbU/P